MLILKLSFKQYNGRLNWSPLIFGILTSAVPPLVPDDGGMLTFPKEKPQLPYRASERKQSINDVTLLASCYPEAIITRFAFWLRMWKELEIVWTLRIVKIMSGFPHF